MVEKLVDGQLMQISYLAKQHKNKRIAVGYIEAGDS